MDEQLVVPELREQAIKDIADGFGVNVGHITYAAHSMAHGDASEFIVYARYAVEQRTRVLQLESALATAERQRDEARELLLELIKEDADQSNSPMEMEQAAHIIANKAKALLEGTV